MYLSPCLSCKRVCDRNLKLHWSLLQAMLCPHLELLLLGGSVRALGLSRVEAVSEDTISSAASTLVRIIELLPRLRVLELTFFTTAVVQAVR